MSEILLVQAQPTEPAITNESAFRESLPGIALLLLVCMLGAGIIYLKYLIHTGRHLEKPRK